MINFKSSGRTGRPSLNSARFLVLLNLFFVALAGSTSAFSADALLSQPTVATTVTQQSAQSNEVVRTRPVLVNAGLLSGAGDVNPGTDAGASVVSLELFDGKNVSAALQSARSPVAGMTAWTGQLIDDPVSQVTIVVNGQIVQANIRSVKHGDYQIRHMSKVAGQDIHDLREIDPSGFPDDHPPGYEEHNSAGHDHSSSMISPSEDGGATGDSAANIDILVVYTPASKTAVGGAAQMDTLIALATTETNDSYTNSGITTQFTVVGMQEIAYTESGSFFTDVDRLENTSDGYMDSVHTLRASVKADMVGLLINTTQYCGVASGIMATAATAFQVTYHGCATGYYSFAHEFGHLQGARHDWFVDSTNNSPFTYNHGFVDPANSWRTIMAYGNDCSGCTRIKYWSNPDNTMGGQAMGIPEGSTNAADNRKTLNNTAFTVANFVQAGTTSTPSMSSPQAGSTLSGSTQTFSWSSNGATVTNYTLWVGDAIGNAAYYNSGGQNGSVTSRTVNGLPEDGSTVFVRLWYKLSGSGYAYEDYTYTAVTVAAPIMLMPTSGALLSSGESFAWTPQGSLVENWSLWIGSTAGTRDIYSSGRLLANTQNQYVAPIASSTGEVHLTLYYKGSVGPWKKIQDVYYTETSDPGFSETFNGTMSNWTINNGVWNVVNGAAKVKDADAPADERVSITRTEGFYADIDYTIRAYRAGTQYSANTLVVRSSGGTSTDGYCQDCYLFQWTTGGSFSIFRRVAGSLTAVQSWTSSSAVTSGWNTIRVLMVGSQYWFIINGELVATGTDTTHPFGKVGVEAYKGASATDELSMWIRYAVLDVPTADIRDVLDGMQVSPEQQDLNAQAGSSAGNQDSAN